MGKGQSRDRHGQAIHSGIVGCQCRGEDTLPIILRIRDTKQYIIS